MISQVDPNELLTTAELREIYKFPTRQQVRQFLAYWAHQITVLKKGRLLLVKRGEFDAFIRRQRRLEIVRRIAQLDRQSLDTGTQFRDVHADESRHSTDESHPNLMGSAQ